MAGAHSVAIGVPSFFSAHPDIPAGPTTLVNDRSLTSGYAVRLRSLERNAGEQRRRIVNAKTEIAEARRWLRDIERAMKNMAEPSKQPGAK